MKEIICCNEKYCSKIDTCQQANNEVPRDNCGLTELHLAAFWNDEKAAELLLTKDVNVNCKSICCKTPLLIAVQHRNLEVAEVLLTYGANVNIPDHRGASPLKAAIEAKDEELIDLLIAYCLGG